MKKKPERKVSFPEALGLLAVVIVVIFLNAMKFSIGTGLSVLGVAMIVAAYAMVVLRIPWDDMMADVLKVFHNGMGAVQSDIIGVAADEYNRIANEELQAYFLDLQDLDTAMANITRRVNEAIESYM